MPKFKVTITLTQTIEDREDNYDELEEGESLLDKVEEFYGDCDLNEFAEGSRVDVEVTEEK